MTRDIKKASEASEDYGVSPSGRLAPGKSTRVAVRYGDVQMRTAPAAGEDAEPFGSRLGRGNIQGVAADGVSEAGGRLPYADAIQASFGAHDVSGVRSHVGGEAGASCDAIGAEAYATGNDVAFRAIPDLHTAAHEAAHVVQQRAGVSLKGGVGAAGDAYEQHADKVADLVVAGESAEGLLTEMTGAGGGLRGPQVQRKPGDVVPRPKKGDVSGKGVRDASSLGLDGIRCGEEESDTGACFLSANARDAVRSKMTLRMEMAGRTFAGVVNEERIKNALKPKGGALGLAVDLMYVFMRSAAPQFATAISTMKKTVDLGAYGSFVEVERVFSERAEQIMASVFVAGTRRARSELRSLTSALEASSESKREKFLNGLEGRLNVQVDQMHTEAIASMSDAKLIAFAAYWDPAIHTPEAYRAELERLLAAHGRVEAIGTPSNHLRVVEGPEGRRRLAHCKTHGGGLAFVAWVDDRFLKKAVSKNRKVRDRTGDVFTGVTSIRYDHHQFVMADGRNRRKGLAKDHPAVKAWIEESAPVFVEETYHPETGKVSGGGVHVPDSFDQVKSNDLNVGPFDGES